MTLRDLSGWHGGGFGSIGPGSKMPTGDAEGTLDSVGKAMQDDAITIKFSYEGGNWFKAIRVDRPEYVDQWISALKPYYGHLMAEVVKVTVNLLDDPDATPDSLVCPLCGRQVERDDQNDEDKPKYWCPSCNRRWLESQLSEEADSR